MVNFICHLAGTTRRPEVCLDMPVGVSEGVSGRD